MPTSFIETHDGVQLFYKDLGPKDAQPIVFHHGWPLSADDWDAQMMAFLANGFRVIAHDHRGHGRSSQTDTRNEMDTYAADVTALTDHLDLHDAVHIGHSTGGGEVARYVAQSKPGRVAKAVLIGAVPRSCSGRRRTRAGCPSKSLTVSGRRSQPTPAQLSLDLPTGAFYGINRPGARISEGVIRNWWRQGMKGGAKAHYDCIKAFSETDFTDDLKSISVPMLVMHGDDDQIVPYADSAPLSANLLSNGRLKTYLGLPHGMCMTHSEVINADLLDFVRG